MEHTKTPWKYEYEGSGDYAIFGSDNTDIGTAWSKDAHFLGLGGKAEENLANAEFIIQACNAYDKDQQTIKDLLEACERALPLLGLAIAEDVFKNCVAPKNAENTLSLLQQAIAKAKE